MGPTPKLPVSEPGATPGGTVALLLPGMSLNETVFPDLGIPVIAADFNGFDGRTDGPADRGTARPAEWSAVMASYVEAAERLTHTALWRSARRRLVVGHSFGGMLALAWMLDRRPPVDGAVLIATTAGPMYDVARIRLVPGVHLPVAPFMRLWDSRLATGMMKLLTGARGRREIDFSRYAGRSDLAIGLAGWRATAAAAKHSYRAAMRGFDVRHRLPEIAIPVVVLHGTGDVYFATRVARGLADGLPGGTLDLVDGARHVLPLSHGHAVRDAVRRLG